MNAMNQIYQFSMLNIYLYILSVKVGRSYICAILEFGQNFFRAKLPGSREKERVFKTLNFFEKV